ncbi:MAG: FadR/GntR family transcriptional regulator, partial [Pseudonocardiaceae bacterium]
EQVRQQLQASIERGDFKPGEQLPSERELSSAFGVSRVSVREAIRSLAAIGFVEVQQGRGCFVSQAPGERYASSFSHWLSFHRKAVLELLAVRGALDELAAESAATRGAGTKSLKAVNQRFRRAAKNGSLSEIVARDEDFHNAIGKASGSALLAGLLAELHALLAPSRYIGLSAPGRPERSARDHDAVIEAIATRDAEAARAAVARHIEGAREAMLERQEEHAARRDGLRASAPA